MLKNKQPPFPKQGIAPSAFGDVVWVAAHKLAHQKKLTGKGTAAIMKMLPCASCRTSMALFCTNLMDPEACKDQEFWWDSAHRSVSAKLHKPIPSKQTVAKYQTERYTLPARDEVFAMLLFFLDHAATCAEMGVLKHDLMQADEEVKALSRARNVHELVAVFNSFNAWHVPELLARWVVEGARQISR